MSRFSHFIVFFEGGGVVVMVEGGGNGFLPTIMGYAMRRGQEKKRTK